MGRGVLGNRVAFNVSRTPAERMLWDQERRRLVNKVVMDPESEEEEEEEPTLSEQKRVTSKTAYKKFINWAFVIAIIGGFAVAAFCTYALIIVATSEPVDSSSDGSTHDTASEGAQVHHGSACSGWNAFEHRLSEWIPMDRLFSFLWGGHHIQPKKWNPCLSDPNSDDDFDAPADDTLASPYHKCIELDDILKQAYASKKPYLMIPGWKEGYSLQQENLIRGLWLAHLTNSILVLPPFYVTLPRRHILRRERMGKYFDIERLIVHVYCTTGIRVVPHLPPSLDAQISNQTEDLDKLASRRNALSIPVDLLFSKNSDDAGIKAWLEDASARINNKEIQLFVYPHPLKLNFTTPEQIKLKKEGMAALRPSKAIREVSQKIIVNLGKEFRLRVGGSGTAKFAAVQLHLENGQNSLKPEEILGKLKEVVDPATTVLYIASGPFADRDVVTGTFGKSFSVIDKYDYIGVLKREFPEEEILIALDQWVLKEANLFLGYSNSAFARMIYQARCFTYTVDEKLVRDSMFYDKGPFLIPCRIKPFSP